MKSSLLTQLAALKGASAESLKARWRELFDTEPPAYNRRFLESRLAYRIQELAYGWGKSNSDLLLPRVSRTKTECLDERERFETSPPNIADFCRDQETIPTGVVRRVRRKIRSPAPIESHSAR